MPSWKGNPDNPVPNPIQESMARSEKRIGDNRSFDVRRDTDQQKDFTITLKDIDETISQFLQNLQITVVDEGNSIEVPIYYGSPEKWVTARRDGYLRDRQGKLQLPVMIFRRTASENDNDHEIFNRYLKYPLIRKYSPKNKYTQFSMLAGQNTPVHEVYAVTVADHMILTYTFIAWTEYHEQMNAIVEKIKFSTKDYWGTKEGFRFRSRVEPMTHTIDLTVDDDRMVRTEFTVITNGYILPADFKILDTLYPSTQKLFTPKKVFFGVELTGTMEEIEEQLRRQKEGKIKSQNFPNLDRDDEPPPPPIVFPPDSGFTPGLVATPTPLPPQLTPSQPLFLTASNSGFALLNWNSIGNVASYSIERSADGVHFSPLVDVSNLSSSYSDLTVGSGSTYTYEIAGYNSAGTGSFSNTSSVHFNLPASCHSSSFPAQLFSSSLDLTLVYDLA